MDLNNLVEPVYRREGADRPASVTKGFSAYAAQLVYRNPLHGEIRFAGPAGKLNVVGNRIGNHGAGPGIANSLLRKESPFVNPTDAPRLRRQDQT